LIWEKSFQKTWGVEFGKDLTYIKSKGNDAVHKTIQLESNESMACVKYLFRFCFAVVRIFSENPPPYQNFDEKLIGKTGLILSEAAIEKIRNVALS
jgi:hypothetical protein